MMSAMPRPSYSPMDEYRIKILKYGEERDETCHYSVSCGDYLIPIEPMDMADEWRLTDISQIKFFKANIHGTFCMGKVEVHVSHTNVTFLPKIIYFEKEDDATLFKLAYGE